MNTSTVLVSKKCGHGPKDVLIGIGSLEILWKNSEPRFRKTGGYPGTRDVVTGTIQIPAGIHAGPYPLNGRCRLYGGHLNRVPRDIMEE